MKPRLSYDLRECPIATVRDLCERFHGYGSVSDSATYAFAVYEDGRAVAAYIWQPPPPGAARSRAATCRACTDRWSELWQLKYNRADEKKNLGEMKRLVDLAHARQRAGRKIHVSLPAPPERHASYEAR